MAPAIAAVTALSPLRAGPGNASRVCPARARRCPVDRQVREERRPAPDPAGGKRPPGAGRVLAGDFGPPAGQGSAWHCRRGNSPCHDMPGGRVSRFSIRQPLRPARLQHPVSGQAADAAGKRQRSGCPSCSRQSLRKLPAAPRSGGDLTPCRHCLRFIPKGRGMPIRSHRPVPVPQPCAGRNPSPCCGLRCPGASRPGARDHPFNGPQPRLPPNRPLPSAAPTGARRGLRPLP